MKSIQEQMQEQTFWKNDKMCVKMQMIVSKMSKANI